MKVAIVYASLLSTLAGSLVTGTRLRNHDSALDQSSTTTSTTISSTTKDDGATTNRDDTSTTKASMTQSSSTRDYGTTTSTRTTISSSTTMSTTTTALCEGGCEYIQKFTWNVDGTGKMTGGFHHTPSHKATPEDSDCRSDIATGGGTFELTLPGGGAPVAITRDMLNTELRAQFRAARGDPRDDEGYFTGDGSVAGGLPDGVSAKAFKPPDDVDTWPPTDYGDIKAPTATAFNLDFWHDVHCYCDDASHHNAKKQTIKFSSAAPPAGKCKLARGKYTCEFKETDDCKKTTRSRHGRRATRKIIFEPDL